MAETATQKQEESKTENASGDGLLKAIGAATTITVAVLYGVGLLVTNAYLLSIGVTDFNLFRARCVLTGIWAVPIIFLMCLPGVLSLKFVSDEEKKEKHPILLVISFAFVGLGLSVSVGGLAGITFNIRLAGWYGAGVLSFMLPVFTYLPLYFTKKYDRRPGIKPGPPNPWYAWIFMLLCVVASTFYIGKIAYPSASAAFGGGKPQKARLILNHEGVATWNKLPGSVDYDALATKAGTIASVPASEPVLTPEVEILYENDSLLVIKWKLQEPTSIVMLDRKLVSAVIPTEKQF